MRDQIQSIKAEIALVDAEEEAGKGKVAAGKGGEAAPGGEDAEMVDVQGGPR